MTTFDFIHSLCKIFATSSMKFPKSLRIALLAGLSTSVFHPARAASPDSGQVAVAVARWLEQSHYTRQKLDDEISAKLLTTYLELLDYNHLYFTQADVD